MITCPTCNGQGTIECDCCEGKGIEYRHEAWYANDGSGIKGEDIAEPCPDCEGEGTKICPQCEGDEEIDA